MDRISVPPPLSKAIVCDPADVNHRGHAENSFPVEFSDELAEVVFNWVSTAYQRSWPIDFHPPQDLEVHVQDEMYRFSRALKAYEESEEPLLSIAYLLGWIKKGVEAITFLKRLKSIHLVQSRGFWFDEQPDYPHIFELSKTLPKMKDVGQIFNVRYWFFWSQPDEHDWEACWEPLPVLDKKLLKDLEDTVFNILPDQVETIHEEEVLLSISGSSTRKKDGKPSKVFVEKQTANHFSDKPLAGYGSYIQKCPGDTRFSITLSVPQSNSVKLIEKQVALLAEEVPWSNYTHDVDTFFQRFEKFKRQSDWFYCRDLKKDGLTKVRPAVRAVCNAIKRKFPHLPCVNYFGIYDGFSIQIDGKWHHPPRGVGLGMSSAITTILQSAVFKIIQERMEILYPEAGACDALFYNDDAALGFDQQDTAESFKEAEDQVFLELGFIKSKTKSFDGDFFVLCENYSEPSLDKKDSMQRYMLELPLTAVNVSHAKFLFTQALRTISTVDWTDYIEMYVSRFGREYYYGEEYKAAQFGGWVPAMYQKVDIALYTHEGPITKQDMAASLAFTMEKPYAKHLLSKYSDKKYIAPIEQIYGPGLVVPDGKSYYTGMSEKDVARTFQTFTQQGSKSGYWNHILSKRRKSYKVHLDGPRLLIDEYYRQYCNLHLMSDVLPPKELFVCGEDVHNFERVEEIYKPQNPYMSYLAWFNPGKFSEKVYPWPVPPDKVRHTVKRMAESDKILSSYMLPFLECQNDTEIQLVDVPVRAIPSTQWYDVTNVRRACLALYHWDVVPVGVERESLQYMKDVDLDMFRRLSSRASRAMLDYLSNLTGFKRAAMMIKHSSTFVGAVEDEPYYKEFLKRKLGILKLVEQSLSAVSTIDLQKAIDENKLFEDYNPDPLKDDEYFQWENSQQNYLDWRNEYFHRIQGSILIIRMLNISNLDTENSDPINDRGYRWNEQCVLDTICQYLFIQSGGTIDENGCPNVNLDLETFFAEEAKSDTPESSESGRDIFGESDDDAPLFFD